MGANDARLSVSEQASADAFKHDQMLLRAVYKAQRVMYRERYCFIQLLRVGLSGGGVETTVYLAGNPEPVLACEITLAPEVV